MNQCHTGLIVMLVTALFVSSSALANNRVALVVGNSDYTHAEVLKNPSNDAVGVAEALRSAGFNEVKLELDLDYAQMRRALGEFAKAAAGADVALVYFAGHGMEVGGDNYLIPVDAKLSHIDDVEFEALPLSAALRSVDRASSLKLVVLDACRVNPFISKMARKDTSRSVGRGLARVDPTSGDTMVAYAAKEGTVAADGSNSNSPYASALIKHIATPGLDVRLMFGRVRDDVLDLTNGKQEPFTYGSLGGDELFLTAYSQPSERLKSEPGVQGPPSKVSEAAKAWEAVKDTANTEFLEAFIERFGETFYAELARRRVKALSALILDPVVRQKPEQQAKRQTKLTGQYTSVLGGWGEGELEIRTNNDGSQSFSTEVWYENGHSCTLQGTAVSIDSGWRYMDGGSCILEMQSEGNGKVTFQTEPSASCDDYCGMRATLDDLTFKKAR